MTSPRILYTRSLLAGARPHRRRHHHPRRRPGTPRPPAQLLPPPVDPPRPPSRVQVFRSNCSASCPAFKSLRAQTRLPLGLCMPCYQGAVTVPSSSDDSIKKMVHFKGVKVATEKSSGVSPVSYHVT